MTDCEGICVGEFEKDTLCYEGLFFNPENRYHLQAAINLSRIKVDTSSEEVHFGGVLPELTLLPIKVAAYKRDDKSPVFEGSLGERRRKALSLVVCAKYSGLTAGELAYKIPVTFSVARKDLEALRETGLVWRMKCKNVWVYRAV